MAVVVEGLVVLSRLVYTTVLPVIARTRLACRRIRCVARATGFGIGGACADQTSDSDAYGQRQSTRHILELHCQLISVASLLSQRDSLDCHHVKRHRSVTDVSGLSVRCADVTDVITV
jgi:hypothetical protein